MKLKIHITMETDAFKNAEMQEAGRIIDEWLKPLRHDQIEAGENWPLFDINGKRVGEAKVTAERPPHDNSKAIAAWELKHPGENFGTKSVK